MGKRKLFVGFSHLDYGHLDYDPAWKNGFAAGS